MNVAHSPGRAVDEPVPSLIMDDEHMRPVLEKVLTDAHRTEVRVRKLKAKRVRSRSMARHGTLHVRYDMGIDVDGERQTITCIGLHPAPDTLWDPTVGGGTRNDETQPFVASLDDLDLALWSFPLDPELPALNEIMSPDGPEILRPLLGGAVDATEPVEMSVPQYKPFARAVIRASIAPDGQPARTAYVKLFADDRGRQIHEDLRQIAEGSRASALRVPEPLHYDEHRHMSLISEVEGTGDFATWIDHVEHGEELPSGVDHDRVVNGVSAAADALLALQAIDVQLPRSTNFRDEWTAMATDVGDLTPTLDAEMASALSALLERLDAAEPAQETMHPAHGSFRHTQMLGDETDLAVIDWDGLRMAPSGLDAATFICRLLKQPVTSGVVGDNEMRGLADVFRQNFLADKSPADAHDLAVWEAMVLTRRAIRELRKRSGKPVAAAGNHLAAATETLDRLEGAS